MGGILANRWWIVFACACGLLVGTGSVLIFSFAVFLKPVTEDLGLSRGALSTALWSATWLTALACPVVGWLIDRWGTRQIMIPGVLAFAFTVAGFGLMRAEPLFLVFLIFGLVGLAGGIQTPVPYAAVISRWFDRDRGFALGVATAGVGAGVVLIPQFAAFLIDWVGWRAAYFGLAISVVVLAWLPVFIFVREPSLAEAADNSTTTTPQGIAGIEAMAALKTRRFWALTTAFFFGVMAINGTIVHIVALLTDRGVALQLATTALSAAGIAIIIGRIICGWCLDRFWGPYVAVFFFILPMFGIALLESGWGNPIPLLGAALCGAGIGAEIDLMAFFVSRYFGLKAYAKIYGLMFMVFNVGTGLGPALSGRAFDIFHSYSQIFMVYEGALVVTSLLLLRLGEYPYPAPKASASLGLKTAK